MPDAGQVQAEINRFFEEFTDRWVEGDPNQAVSTGYFTGEKQDALSRQLTPQTREYDLARNALAREGLAGLAALDFSQATQTQQRAAEVMRWLFETSLALEPWQDYAFYPLQQMDGTNVSVPNALTVVHPLASARDAENYVARLAQVDDRIREATEDSAARAERGSAVPDYILRATIEQMQRFIDPAPAENPLVTTLAGKTADLAGFGPGQREQLLQQAEQIVGDEVYPAWQDAIAELNRQLPFSTAEAGIYRFAGGPEIYRLLLRYYTTTDLTADEIHEIGLREVARIEAEMDALFGQLGMTEGSINARLDAVSSRMAYPNDEAGRAALTEDFSQWLADALQRSAGLFDRMPKIPVIAQPFPEFRWESAAASYTVPPLDESRPGIFQFPLRENEMTAFRKRSLVYHETVPGHHFQLALNIENTELPRFMQIRAFGGITAITEGWALYAERLAAESGWYEGDIEGQLGYLYSMLFRARRLVVDTGLHARGWTRQQAIDYGIPPSEVDRYTVRPGQACSYMIGQLRIVELRERARAALGDRFSIREFHNVVLGAGIVPLSLLETIVDDYIASASA
jgi:uncharacterized protein (DUF885 family)